MSAESTIAILRASLVSEWTKRGLPVRLLETLVSTFEACSWNAEDCNRPHEPSFKNEVEAKFPVTSDCMDKLRSLGVKAKESVHEVNEMFDCNGELASTDSRLRLRTRYELKDGWESGLLTIKQPQPASSDGLKREFELETELAADELSRLRSNLKTINYRLVSSYERVRHVLSGPFRDVEVVVDNLPDIGRFLEIEGEEDAVREAAELLGLSMNAALQDAYDTLHYNWCLSQGKSEVYFVEFSATEREFILAAERILFIPDSV